MIASFNKECPHPVPEGTYLVTVDQNMDLKSLMKDIKADPKENNPTKKFHPDIFLQSTQNLVSLNRIIYCFKFETDILKKFLRCA